MDAPGILVTGGAGFVGSHIVQELRKRHPEYRITVLDLQPPSTLEQAGCEVSYVRADVTAADEILKAVGEAKPFLIVHTAGVVPTGSARYGRRDNETTLNINVGGTRNVLDAAKRCGVRAFVYTSSCTIITDDNDNDYPNIDERISTPASALVYGQSKAAAEALVLSANSPELRTCALRPSTIMGPGDTHLVPTIHACIAKFETPFRIGSGLNLYDFSYVGNVAYAHVLAVENMLTTQTAAGETFFISNQEPVPFRDFCKAVWREFGHTPPFEVFVPKPVAWATGWLAEWITWVMGTDSTLSRGSVKDYCQTAYANTDKARRILGYERQVGLQEGIRISCAEYAQRLAQNTAKPLSRVTIRDVWAAVGPSRIVNLTVRSRE